jgi:hypothetical protein
MGGLAIRYASAMTENGVLAGSVLRGVVTVDTPHRGSYWGGTGYARLFQSAGRLDTNLGPLPDPSKDGATCLSRHDGGDSFPKACVGPPPYLPADVPLHQIAGEVSVDRWFGPIKLYRFSLKGDAVVDLASESGYAGSGPATPKAAGPVATTTVACSVATNDLMSTRDAASVVWKYLAHGDLPLDPPIRPNQQEALTFLAIANKRAECSHALTPANSSTAEAVSHAINLWLSPADSPPPSPPPSTAPGTPLGRIAGAPIPLSIGAWSAYGDVVISPGETSGSFRVSYPGTYWGGARHDAAPGCDYVLSGWARIVEGDVYGFTVRADLSQDAPIGRVFQYEVDVQDYRDTDLPDSEGGILIPSANDLSWHRISVAVLGDRYAESIDGTVVSSGTTPLTCGGLYLRIVRAVAEFRDLTVTALA